jgi:hypothetical protein
VPSVLKLAVYGIFDTMAVNVAKTSKLINKSAIDRLRS